MQDIALAVEMIANADASERLAATVLEAHEQGRLVDVSAALVIVGAALVEQLTALEGRTSQSLLDDLRIELMLAQSFD